MSYPPLADDKGGWVKQLSAVCAMHVVAVRLLAADPAALMSPSTSPAVVRAMDSVQAAIPRAEADPSRPVYHFHSPALWMNDPNGPIYHKGTYHLFYQFNPYGDTWGHMHWGHARSRDLVHWQHLPIALWPSEELGEEHVFSGCTVISRQEAPMIFYTSIARGKPAETDAQQWAAVGDQDLITWRKHPDNPILTQQVHGATKVYDWRDPFVFQNKGATYMVLGGNLNQRQGGKAVVNLYRAEGETLTRWTYVGVLFTHPNPNVLNIECPNFFKLGDHWVLLVSPHGLVEHFGGEFDATAGKFIVHHSGVLDYGENYYAPNSLSDRRGRRVVWGWVKGFKPDRGWNGCLSLPRVLSWDTQGRLLQKPAQELKKLRTDHFRLSDVPLASLHEVSGLRGDCLELYAEIEPLQAAFVQLQVRRSEDGSRFVPISFDGAALEVAGTKVPFGLQASERTLKLHIFLDKSVLEVFANDRACVTRVIDPGENDLGVALTASPGTARIRSLHGWKLRPIW
jgi:beta-fructofuranosidase